MDSDSKCIDIPAFFDTVLEVEKENAHQEVKITVPIFPEPETPFEKKVFSMTPGELVDMCKDDGVMKLKVYRILRCAKPIPHRFNLIFLRDYCEIKMESQHALWNFTWRVMDKSVMVEEGTIHRSPDVHTYGTACNNKVILALQLFSLIREIFSPTIGKVHLNTEILTPKRKAKRIALEIVKFEEVQELHILGKRESSHVGDIILNNLKVSERLNVRGLFGKGKLSPEKMAAIPRAWFGIPKPTPERIFEFCRGEVHIEVPEVTTVLCNGVIHLWLQSRSCDLDRLILDGPYRCSEHEYPKNPYCGIFEKLGHVARRRYILYVARNEWHKGWSLHYMQNIGVRIIREDGAILTVLASVRKGFVSLRVEYYGRKDFAELTPSVQDRLQENVEAQAKHRNDYVAKAAHADRVMEEIRKGNVDQDWLEKRQQLHDAELKFMEQIGKWEISNLQEAFKEIRMDEKHVMGAKDRFLCGYFCLPKPIPIGTVIDYP